MNIRRTSSIVLPTGKAGIQSFPTTWFIDRDGRIAFVKVGWTQKLTEEFSWRIEALRAKEVAATSNLTGASN